MDKDKNKPGTTSKESRFSRRGFLKAAGVTAAAVFAADNAQVSGRNLMTAMASPTADLETRRLPKLDRLEFITVKLPFVSPFGTSVHTWTDKEALLLRIGAGGAEGWGECVCDPDPFYSSETTSTARHILKDFLFPLLEPGITLGELESRFHHVRGNMMAKATIENALLTLMAVQEGIPLHQLLGAPAKKIMSGLSIGLKDSIKELVASAEEGVSKGYHRIKLKIKKGQDIEWVAAVRQRFPDIKLMVDANGDYSIGDAPLLKKLDAFDLMMIEQPLSYTDIYQHSLLQKELRTPLCLDESIHNLDDAKAAVEMKACRVINIKQGRVGGLMESMRIARYCADNNIGVWSGGMDETGIGRALNIHLQTIAGFNLPGDTSETSRYFKEDITEPPVVLDAQGFVAIPPGPGLGVRVLPDRLLARTLQIERIT